MLILQGSEQDVEIDEVVLATGYRPDIPFVESRFFGKLNESGDVERLLLYKGMYSLTEDSIAFLGMIEAAGNLGQMFEMQARHAMAVFNKKIELTSSKVRPVSQINALKSRLRRTCFAHNEHSRKRNFPCNEPCV